MRGRGEKEKKKTNTNRKKDIATRVSPILDCSKGMATVNCIKQYHIGSENVEVGRDYGGKEEGRGDEREGERGRGREREREK